MNPSISFNKKVIRHKVKRIPSEKHENEIYEINKIHLG